jgi:hypothetical protein
MVSGSYRLEDDDGGSHWLMDDDGCSHWLMDSGGSLMLLHADLLLLLLLLAGLLLLVVVLVLSAGRRLLVVVLEAVGGLRLVGLSRLRLLLTGLPLLLTDLGRLDGALIKDSKSPCSRPARSLAPPL